MVAGRRCVLIHYTHMRIHVAIKTRAAEVQCQNYMLALIYFFSTAMGSLRLVNTRVRALH